MARQAVIRTTGGPEVIEWVEVNLPPPGPGEVLLRVHAVGVNRPDIMQRQGAVQLPVRKSRSMSARSRRRT